MAVQQREILEDEVFDDVEAMSADDADGDSGQEDERFAADTSGKTLDATQMYLNEIGFYLCCPLKKKYITHDWLAKATRWAVDV